MAFCDGIYQNSKIWLVEFFKPKKGTFKPSVYVHFCGICTKIQTTQMLARPLCARDTEIGEGLMDFAPMFIVLIELWNRAFSSALWPCYIYIEPEGHFYVLCLFCYRSYAFLKFSTQISHNLGSWDICTACHFFPHSLSSFASFSR